MKVPISWLKEHVDFDVGPEDLASKLTFAGTEVEGIERVAPRVAGVVAGEITGVRPHPRADALRLCTVSRGPDTVEVVCGAENFDVGDKAVFAPLGATLPSGIELGEAEIRGERSQGMLCAEDELGISDDHSGIVLLPRDVRAGESLDEALSSPETVLSLEVTWNRPDCLSVMGIAREVAAILRSELKPLQVDFPEGGEKVEDLAKVAVEDPEGCPRYTARVLSGLEPGPAPLWMRRRLGLCGVRSINNIVDVTNYVMLECGHPLHAFDYALLRDHEIRVRRGEPGETITTLDGIRREVGGLLVIADAGSPVAVAGVMGGEGSEIGPGTTMVLLESASFDPAGVKSVSSSLGLSSESSYRFERGVDVSGVDLASRRAACLMAKHAAATAATGVLDVFPAGPPERRVSCRFDRVKGLLGVDIPPDEVVTILDSLGMPVVERDEGSCTVSVPSLRGDVAIEADLIEEVARLHGLDKLPAPVPCARIVEGADDVSARALSVCRSSLVGLGLTEIMNYTFVSAQLLDTFEVDDPDARVVLPNPVSADEAVMRSSLLPQMVDSLGRNVSRQVTDAALFEMGKVFLGHGEGGVHEEDRAAIGLIGGAGRVGLDRRTPVSPAETMLWLKGIVESLCSRQHVDGVATVSLSHPCFEEGWAASIVLGGEICGMLGLVREPIRRNWRLSGPVGAAEIRLAPLLEHVFRVGKLQPVSAYPAVTRDVAMVVDDAVTHEEIVSTIRKTGPVELTHIELFDTFRGEGIGGGKKSLAYSLVYRSLERSLTDEDANAYHDAVKDALRRELKAQIREG